MTAIGHTGRQKLDRTFQRQLLERLANYYPHSHAGRWQELHEDEATVKRFYRENGVFRLQPENPTMKPIIVPEVTILGKVVSLYRVY